MTDFEGKEIREGRVVWEGFLEGVCWPGFARRTGVLAM